MMMRKWRRTLLVLMTFSLIISILAGCRVEQESKHSQEVDNHSNNPSSQSQSNNVTSTTTPKDKQQEGDPFDRNSPKLLGLSLTSTEKEIAKQLGQPQAQFIMDDTPKIEIWEYEGYTVGCMENGHIAFVEVSGAGQSTGIEGLKVGDHQGTAEKVLGKPDRNTGYVWSYAGDDALLRLDLDPKTQIIQSVKLFSHPA
ncbi:DNA uptake lipoprotein [Paenibacillus sp. SC116]|uniref:DNA uptake lipoprotein n=1 Tax=Paenibacillus sp. SC116 TaxID=2968986 RepID=UPI00215A28B1|nr:DNA uptake lipoprotein [Paenibacillus sp. SC116]